MVKKDIIMKGSLRKVIFMVKDVLRINMGKSFKEIGLKIELMVKNGRLLLIFNELKIKL